MSETLLGARDLSALFERSGIACCIVLPETWQVVFVTDRYLELVRRPRHDVLGQCLLDLWSEQAIIPCAQGELLARLRRGLTSAEPTRESVPLSWGSIWLERVTPIRSATLGSRTEPRASTGAVTHIVHSIEGPLQSDTAALVARSAELEARVRERNADLEQTSERLLRETAEHMKTERALKRSEEQLKQAQKLDALGRLAGGIAHDFNNLLSVMLGYSSSLFLEPGFSPTVRSQIGEIRDAAERAAELTLQLLAFSRCQVLEPRVVDLNMSLLGLERMLTRLLGEDIELRLVLAPGIGRVRVDPGQIEQVILNLVINARDAMPTGGSLSISTANVDLDELHASAHLGTSAGPHVLLSVSDTGCGMDKATQARIFEPFFTTKEAGKGTGLGLATAFGIVKQSGGTIWVYSELGTGTSFKVYMPRVDAAAEALRRASISPQLGGTETILVVEDDPHVRKLACTVLRQAGYTVLEAEDADEALRLCKHATQPIDLLLTDVVMPKVSGRILADRVLALQPTTKLLFMSGYTDDAVLRHGVIELGAAFLQKPLTPATLTRKVREVLDIR